MSEVPNSYRDRVVTQAYAVSEEAWAQIRVNDYIEYGSK